MNIAISNLVNYAITNNLIEKIDKNWAVNAILETLKLDSFDEPVYDEANNMELSEILDILLNDACSRGVISENNIVLRDLFDTELLGKLTPRPSQVLSTFFDLYKENPEKATDWYYEFSQNTNYIRRDRISRDLKWVHDTEFGALDITINLSKPEFDPKTIATMRTLPPSSYPKCNLCIENEGYHGRINHPARQNHRIIPLNLNNTPSFLQFSPYVYFNEHCIVFNKEHTPMKISADIFAKLLSFVEQFPHYFIGANSDLPIVGGSIATHDHFQGGKYNFALMLSPIKQEISFEGFSDIKCGIVKWPLSVIRLEGEDKNRVVELADKILQNWKNYTDIDANIFSHTDDVRHSTITPIARFVDGNFVLDLILRNNLTTDEFPGGIYHAHQEFHNIKKENIGLIEAMGLAVLPARLKIELVEICNCLIEHKNLRENDLTEKHADWVDTFKDSYIFTQKNAFDIIKSETGKVFAKILHNCGVFKCNEQGMQSFLKFINQI